MGGGWVDVVLAGLAVVLAAWCGLLALFVRPLVARWREPVFRCPVLVLESDDWGAGPLAQADVLRRILPLLGMFRDAHGRAAVMSLGVIFEVPDTDRMARENLAHYHGIGFDDDRFGELRDVVAAGIEAGVFEPQLHGQCHYWPDALMAVASADPVIREWLTAPGLRRTEQLPSPLQSRWVDASVLPSRALPSQAIDAAVANEATTFRRHFDHAPRVAVATTFVWTEAVEAAWRQAGIDVVIAPGRRATLRDAAGQPAGVDRTMLTGDRSEYGQCYLVRDVYFEPALGHAPERLVAGLEERTRQGRACLVEMHRFNFLDRPDESLAALRGAMVQALARFPELRFITPLELAQAIRELNPGLVETSKRRRLKTWLQRLAEIPRFTRLSRLTGFEFPLQLLHRMI